MGERRLRLWSIVHRWASLACTLFLLVICISGIPLIFEDEIKDWLDPQPPFPTLPAATPYLSVDRMVEVARRRYPGHVITSVVISAEEPEITIWMAPSFEIRRSNPRSVHIMRFDARSGEIRVDAKPSEAKSRGFMLLVRGLHTNLFMGLAGELFLGLMALLFVAAIVSGFVLYAPFARKVEFGALRTNWSKRLRWLDAHNFLGIVTLVWALVVGFTGFINELSTPFFTLWQTKDLRGMLAPWQGRPALGQTNLVSVQEALNTARQAVPDATFVSVVYPGNEAGTPYQYLFWGRGSSPLTSRLFTPVLVDARTGELTAVMQMPWYLRALQVSRPLHFGDYAGMPLKFIWTVFDLATIFVLTSGLYLWFARKRASIHRKFRLTTKPPKKS